MLFVPVETGMNIECSTVQLLDGMMTSQMCHMACCKILLP